MLMKRSTKLLDEITEQMDQIQKSFDSIDGQC